MIRSFQVCSVVPCIGPSAGSLHCKIPRGRLSVESFNHSRMRGVEVKLKRALAAFIVVMSMICGSLAASAAAHDEVVPSVAEVEAEVALIFERYLLERPDGTWFVDVEAVRADGAPEAELQRAVAGFNSVLGKVVVPEGPDGWRGDRGVGLDHAFGSRAWALCTLDYVAPGLAEGLLTGAVLGWLKKGKYAQVASFLIRVVAPRALLGGGIGLVVKLSVGAGWCWLGRN